MAAMTQLSFGGRRTNSGSRCRRDRWGKEETGLGLNQLCTASIHPFVPHDETARPSIAFASWTNETGK
jgi:hypothetical protein